MAERDQEKWDKKYRQGMGEAVPSSLVERYGSLADGGRALDLACGNGRNSVFLAENGFAVDAVDISPVAVEHVAGLHPDIHAFQEDLDTWTIPENRYELIVNIRFLDRRLFPLIEAGLKPNGLLIFEAFLSEEEESYCLKPNELLDVFRGLRVLHYEDRKAEHSDRFDRSASFVAVKRGPF